MKYFVVGLILSLVGACAQPDELTGEIEFAAKYPIGSAVEMISVSCLEQECVALEFAEAETVTMVKRGQATLHPFTHDELERVASRPWRAGDELVAIFEAEPYTLHGRFRAEEMSIVRMGRAGPPTPQPVERILEVRAMEPGSHD